MDLGRSAPSSRVAALDLVPASCSARDACPASTSASALPAPELASAPPGAVLASALACSVPSALPSPTAPGNGLVRRHRRLPLAPRPRPPPARRVAAPIALALGCAVSEPPSSSRPSPPRAGLAPALLHPRSAPAGRASPVPAPASLLAGCRLRQAASAPRSRLGRLCFARPGHLRLNHGRLRPRPGRLRRRTAVPWTVPSQRRRAGCPPPIEPSPAGGEGRG